MSELPVIPMPLWQKWRRFRLHFLPPLIFLCTLSMICVLWKDYVNPSAPVGQVETAEAPVTDHRQPADGNLVVTNFVVARHTAPGMFLPAAP